MNSERRQTNQQQTEREIYTAQHIKQTTTPNTNTKQPTNSRNKHGTQKKTPNNQQQQIHKTTQCNTLNKT